MHRPLDKAFWRLKCAAEGRREVSLSIRKARRHEHEEIVGNQMAW